MAGLDMKKPTYAPAYIVGVYPRLVEIARDHGYALCLHGSLQRDLDLVAVPWVENPSDCVDLINSFCDEFDIQPNHDIKKPEIKPHGRKSWSIPLWWGAYIDLSVIANDR